MKILVIGAGGFTGKYLYNLLKEKYEVIGTSTTDENFIKLDLSKQDEINTILGKEKPDIICLPAGITYMDYIERHVQESKKVNVGGTKCVVDYCKENNCKLIFFSSDAIFDGKKGPYSENDVPKPISEYGKQKLEAEKTVERLDNFAIIRTSSIYGWDKRKLNFVSRLIDDLKNNKEVKVPIDQFFTPTYVIDLAYTTLKIIEKKTNGIYNVTGPDFLSREEIALKVCEVFKLKKELIIPIKSSELKQIGKRTKYGGLINKKIVEELDISLRGIEEGLKDMSVNNKWSTD